jgi:hypothetical protein
MWRRSDPVLEMSQRTESRPGASCADDNANRPTEEFTMRGPVNAQPRGLITPTMRPMMSPDRDSQIRSTRSIVGAPESASTQLRGLITSIMSPMMSIGEGSHTRPTSGRNRAPQSASSQLRGLIISVPGVHQWRTSPSTPFPSSPSVRTISCGSVFCRPPNCAVDRPANGLTLSRTLLNGDIRAGHGASESQTSPAPASSRGSTVASSRRHRVEREGTTTSPEGSRSNVPSLGLHSFTGLRKSGSKIDNPLSGSCWRGRWPRSKPVPEILSAALRWAK